MNIPSPTHIVYKEEPHFTSSQSVFQGLSPSFPSSLFERQKFYVMYSTVTGPLIPGHKAPLSTRTLARFSRPFVLYLKIAYTHGCISCVPNPVMGALHVLTHLLLRAPLWDGCLYYLILLGELGSREAKCLAQSHSSWKAEPRFRPSCRVPAFMLLTTVLLCYQEIQHLHCEVISPRNNR